MNKNIITVLIFIFLINASYTWAQENGQNIAKKYNIQFPIAELGNCANHSTCKTYCDNETHRSECIAFAKKKGFYQEVEEQRKNPEILKEAQSLLGCDSENSCRSICEKEENHQKCKEFAQKHKLEGPRGNPKDRQILEKAKSILGCDSESSCKSICENPDNHEKCSEFAKQTGLEGGIKRVGPGGCNSEESCRKYCESNMDECRRFAGPNDQKPPPEASRQGPGGCDSEESCKKYCESNPQECGRDQQNNNEITGRPDYKPEAEIQRWENEKKPIENFNNFCQDNPDKCQPPQQPSEQQFPENHTQRERRPPDQPNPPIEQRPSDLTQEVKGVSTEKPWWYQLLNFFLGKSNQYVN